MRAIAIHDYDVTNEGSWPMMLMRAFDSTLASYHTQTDASRAGAGAGAGAASAHRVHDRRVQMVNLAVPATSTAWLQTQVSGLSSMVPGGPLTKCDLVLLDYSVNDADAKALYADDEKNLVDALLAVHDAVHPTPMVLLQAYPWGGR